MKLSYFMGTVLFFLFIALFVTLQLRLSVIQWTQIQEQECRNFSTKTESVVLEYMLIPKAHVICWEPDNNNKIIFNHTYRILE